MHSQSKTACGTPRGIQRSRSSTRKQVLCQSCTHVTEFPKKLYKSINCEAIAGAYRNSDMSSHCRHLCTTSSYRMRKLLIQLMPATVSEGRQVTNEARRFFATAFNVTRVEAEHSARKSTAAARDFFFRKRSSFEIHRLRKSEPYERFRRVRRRARRSTASFA